MEEEKLFENAKAARIFGESVGRDEIAIVKIKRLEFLKRHEQLIQMDSTDYDKMMWLNNQAHFCQICIEADIEVRESLKGWR